VVTALVQCIRGVLGHTTNNCVMGLTTSIMSPKRLGRVKVKSLTNVGNGIMLGGCYTWVVVVVMRVYKQIRFIQRMNCAQRAD
jgi:hypothetical protein